MKVRIGVAMVAFLAAAPGFASDGNLAIFFDSEAPILCGIIPCECSLRIWIYGLLQGASAGGITGVEYKVRIGSNDEPDPGWVFAETFDPSATVIGTGAFNPVDFESRGVNVAWSSCEQGDGYKVLVETVDIFNLGCSTAELRLLVVKHDRPSNPHFQCPLFVLCDAPVYTKVCLGVATPCHSPEPPFPDAMCSTSGLALVNPRDPYSCSEHPVFPEPNCPPVAVEPSSWSQIKSLYRD